MADGRAVWRAANEEEARWGSASGALGARLRNEGRDEHRPQPEHGEGSTHGFERREPSKGGLTGLEFLAASSLGERRPEGERRRHYRTPIAQSWGLQATLRTWDGDVMVAHLLDMSIGGAGVLVRALELPMKVGSAVELRLRGPGLRSPLAVAAEVQRCTPDREGYFYGLRFARVLELGQHMPSSLREVFNRRRSFRVRPNARAGLDLLVAALVDGEPDPRSVIELQVSDISSGGIAFVATDRQVRTLGTGLDLEMQVRLPDHSAALAFIGRVRYRLRIRVGFRYGVAFDTNRTLGFMAQQRVVTGYVLDRQREMLKRPATL